MKNRQTPHEIRLFKPCLLFGALEYFFRTEICRFSKHPVADNRTKNHVWILAVGVQTDKKKNAEEVLVGKLQKVLELLNRIIFSAVSEIRAYYIMYLQDWGKN